jgi:hypothetical protein
MRAILYLGVAFLTASGVGAQSGPARPPIIDVHLHAYSAADWTRRPNPATDQPAPPSAAAHMRATLAEMEKYNIVAAIVSGPLEAVEEWRSAAPKRSSAPRCLADPESRCSGRHCRRSSCSRTC